MITSADEFVRLRSSDEPAEYHRAAHETAPLEVWLEIAERHPEMRFWVAQNKTVPAAVLGVLCLDGDASVRGMVARKRSLPEPLQLVLAGDREEGVRQALVYNARATRAVLVELARDPYEPVRAEAKRRLAERT